MESRHEYIVDSYQDDRKAFVQLLFDQMKQDLITNSDVVNERSPIDTALLIQNLVFDQGNSLSEKEFHEINELCLIDPFWRNLRQRMIQKFFSEQPIQW